MNEGDMYFTVIFISFITGMGTTLVLRLLHRWLKRNGKL